MLVLSAAKADYRSAIAAIATNTSQTIASVLQQVGQETIDYLRSLTDEMRPPAGARLVGPGEGYFSPEEGGVVRAQGPARLQGGGSWRPAHPGHWADVTGQLAAGYGWELVGIQGGWRLVLSNPTEYAAHLEAHDGYFVLSGVADPDGPVYEALQAVAREIAPSWRVELQGVKRMPGAADAQ